MTFYSTTLFWYIYGCVHIKKIHFYRCICTLNYQNIFANKIYKTCIEIRNLLTSYNTEILFIG